MTRSDRAALSRRRRLIAAAAVLAIVGSVFAAAPATAAWPGGPKVLTATSWYGVKLGESLKRVARSHGWTTGSCGEDIDFVNVPRHYRVAVARGARAGHVGFIEAWGRAVRGPHGVRSGVKISRLKKFLRRGTRHQVGDGVHLDTWRYWIIPMKGHFLYVRAGNSNGTGTRDRVSTFGLATTRSVAKSRGETMGGCY